MNKVINIQQNFYVSVIIPFYNVEKYIERSIDSVLIQPEVTELILVNDGSTDNSLSICSEKEKTDKRIKIVTHPNNKNLGVSKSRNLGILVAKNEYIAFLDSDDYFLPNRFLNAKRLFATNIDIDGVYEMIGLVSKNKELKKYSKIVQIKPENLFENLQPISTSVWFHCNGFTVKKSAFLKSGLFDESLQTSEDTFQWFKMAATCKLIPGIIDDYVAFSEERSDSLSSNSISVNSDFILMILKLFKYCKEQNLSNKRKGIVLSCLCYFISLSPYEKYYRKKSRIKLYYDTIVIDPKFVLLKSTFLYKSFFNTVLKNMSMP